ncbi:hypothetical protein [Legionella brunensis]|uniref:Uncharacterized protein n=1 Tax=Legionella brunensis TaxID=29422 RepID=A0A0W0SNH9_9GAMM|nr:hypothetical protein [Legionella brunensis]KTC84851.1 hypothetical protein Lbru_1066 [Legionella brunensis]
MPPTSKQESSENIIKICIVGIGPCGLSLIVSLLEEAKKYPSKRFELNVIEKRDFAFKRRQKLIIPAANLTGEHELRWDDFCKKLFDPTDKLQLNHKGDLVDSDGIPLENINKRQKLLRKWMRQPELFTEKLNIPKNFSIRSLQEALKEHIDETKVDNVAIHWYCETQIHNVDLQQQTVTSDSDLEIPFDFLFVCEGERRELTQQINAKIKSDFSHKLPPFTYEKLGVPSYHMAARLTVKPLSSNYSNYHQFLKQKRTKVSFDINELQKFGWNPKDEIDAIFDDNLYKEHFADTNWKPRLFIASPIPKNIHAQTPVTKRKTVSQWASFFAAVRAKIPQENFVIDTKGEDEKNQNITTFLSDIHYVDNPVRRLPTGGFIILLGDCAMSAYYPIGFSSAIAMNEAFAAACDATRDNDEDEDDNRFNLLIEKYNLFQQFLATEVGFRNKEMEQVVAAIKKIQDVLSKEIANFPLVTKKDMENYLDLNATIELLELFCDRLIAQSNTEDFVLTLQKNTVDLLLSDNERYMKAITHGKYAPLIGNLFQSTMKGSSAEGLYDILEEFTKQSSIEGPYR